jgi:hypothetical protein
MDSPARSQVHVQATRAAWERTQAAEHLSPQTVYGAGSSTADWEIASTKFRVKSRLSEHQVRPGHHPSPGETRSIRVRQTVLGRTCSASGSDLPKPSPEPPNRTLADAADTASPASNSTSLTWPFTPTAHRAIPLHLPLAPLRPSLPPPLAQLPLNARVSPSGSSAPTIPNANPALQPVALSPNPAQPATLSPGPARSSHTQSQPHPQPSHPTQPNPRPSHPAQHAALTLSPNPTRSPLTQPSTQLSHSVPAQPAALHSVHP